MENYSQKTCTSRTSEQWVELVNLLLGTQGPVFDVLFPLDIKLLKICIQIMFGLTVWVLLPFQKSASLFVISLVLYSTVHAPLFRWCTLKTEVKYTDGFRAAYIKLVVCNINCLWFEVDLQKWARSCRMLEMSIRSEYCSHVVLMDLFTWTHSLEVLNAFSVFKRLLLLFEMSKITLCLQHRCKSKQVCYCDGPHCVDTVGSQKLD